MKIQIFVIAGIVLLVGAVGVWQIYQNWFSEPPSIMQRVTLHLEYEGQMYTGSAVQKVELVKRGWSADGGKYAYRVTGDMPFVEIANVGTIFLLRSAHYTGALLSSNEKIESASFSRGDFIGFPELLGFEDLLEPGSYFSTFGDAGSHVTIEKVSSDTPITSKIRKMMPWIERGYTGSPIDGNPRIGARVDLPDGLSTDVRASDLTIWGSN